MKTPAIQTILATLIIAGLVIFSGCGSGHNQKDASGSTDTANIEQSDTVTESSGISDSLSGGNSAQIADNKSESGQPVIMIYNFHLTNRCPSCKAIEEATTKTLETYFKEELKSGKIIRQIMNVEDDANAAICEKYEASGSGMYVTRIINGKETTTDLTGDGFKFARNKQEKFIEILKNTINDYLKS